MDPISVWRWQDAPEALKACFPQASEGAWVAEIPPELMADRVGWMVADAFGLDEVALDHPTKEGWGIRMGSV